MKKIWLLLLFVSLLSGWYFAQETTANDHSELDEVTDVMTDADIAIDEWRISAKSRHRLKTTKTEYNAFVSNLKKRYPFFSWHETMDDEEYVRTKGVSTTNFDGQREALTVTAHKHGNVYETVLLYELYGSSSDENSRRKALDIFSIRTSDLFSKEPVIFTCATGKISDKMDIVLYEKALELMNAFNATFVEHVNEETFVSLSAYTTLWNGSLYTNGNKMNLQIALRDEGPTEGITVSIGTPILTTEY